MRDLSHQIDDLCIRCGELYVPTSDYKGYYCEECREKEPEEIDWPKSSYSG